MAEYNGMKVENSEQLLKLLDSVHHVLRNKSVIDGMIAGANYLNAKAKSKLNASIQHSDKNKINTATLFKTEVLKPKNNDELVGVRTGVKDKKNGYILRFLEWGTDLRKTRTRKNALTGKVISPMNRGRITGNNFFFGTVRDSKEQIFNIVSEAVIKSLIELTQKQNGK